MATIDPPLAIDLFCGAGGLSLGLQQAGFRVAAAAERWAPAARSYRLNFPTHTLLEIDLGEVEPAELAQAVGLSPGAIDLVAGGPPCQGFSIQRIGEDADPRNHLVLKFGDFIRYLRPKMFMMENVPGLLGKRGRELAETFRSQMIAAGYTVSSQVIDAADFGVPQRRRRVVFCGWRTATVAPFHFPPPELVEADHRTVRDAIGDLPSPPADYSPHPDDPLHRWMRVSELNERRLRHIPPGGGFESLPVELRVDCHKGGAERIGHRYVYGRLHPDEPAATITARFDSFTRGKFAHPVAHRNITLREGARLQTFPDGFRFEGSQEEIAAQIGNAVPPLLAHKLGSAILRHLADGVGNPVRPSVTPSRSIAQLSLFATRSDRSVHDG